MLHLELFTFACGLISVCFLFSQGLLCISFHFGHHLLPGQRQFFSSNGFSSLGLFSPLALGPLGFLPLLSFSTLGLSFRTLGLLSLFSFLPLDFSLSLNLPY